MGSTEYITIAADDMVQLTPMNSFALRFEFEEDLKRLDAADPAIGLEEGGYIF
jgi:hypothetical protein